MTKNKLTNPNYIAATDRYEAFQEDVAAGLASPSDYISAHYTREPNPRIVTFCRECGLPFSSAGSYKRIHYRPWTVYVEPDENYCGECI